MKALLYVIAIAAIGAGGWFSYQTMEKFTKLKEDRLELDKNNENRKASIVDTKKEAKAMEAERDKAKAKLAETEADLENAESNVKLSKREAATWKSKIAEQDEKLDSVQKLITSIKKAFSELGPDVQLDQVPGLVKKLEDDLKEANRKLEELQSLTGAADKRVAANNAQIQELTDRITKRAKRIAGNSAEGTITAINHDWGFAIVNIPNNMPVNETSKLIIKRGASFIGNLKINAIEGARIVADVDYKSMTPGMVAQPGDVVVLAKPVTN
ncbi:MAG: hypothetical protein KJO79_05070 [Verrucomicrobiae bacterium]|nr:hypothetical protein [Verrucomicrobiae bacterium]NNJ86530.1 hypothetical protein [Akkermansiaceae bacterium]